MEMCSHLQNLIAEMKRKVKCQTLGVYVLSLLKSCSKCGQCPDNAPLNSLTDMANKPPSLEVLRSFQSECAVAMSCYCFQNYQNEVASCENHRLINMARLHQSPYLFNRVYIETSNENLRLDISA